MDGIDAFLAPMAPTHLELELYPGFFNVLNR
jgi:hypothetical protein